MQISRHWRMNAQRYRLEGVRYEDGKADLQARHRHEQMETYVEPQAAKVERKHRVPAA